MIPLPNVNGKILAKVIEYCRYHVEAAKKGADDKPAKTEDEVKSWDTDFVKVDQATLFDLILVSVGVWPGAWWSSWVWGGCAACAAVVGQTGASERQPPPLPADTRPPAFNPPTHPSPPGCQLPEHQGPAGPHLPDRGQHDQGQDAGGDPQDVQHQE